MTERTAGVSDVLDAHFIARLPRLSLAYQGRVEGHGPGGRRSFQQGAGNEFADHRPLTPGDPPRHVDWKAYARTGRLFVRTFEQESQAQISLLLDVSASMGHGGGAKLDMSKRLAALLAHVALQARDPITLCGLRGSEVELDVRRRSLSQQEGAFDFLRGLSASGTTNLDLAAISFARKKRTRGLAILISDLLDPAGFERGVRRLQRFGYRCQVLQVQSPAERTPPSLGHYELVDCETSERRLIAVDSDVQARYRTAFHARQQAITRRFSQLQVPVATVSSDEPLSRALLRMRRRGFFLS